MIRRRVLAALFAVVATSPRTALATTPPATPLAAPTAVGPALPMRALPKYERPAPSEARLPPLTRTFTKLTLPGVKGAVVGVRGRSARNLWFLTDEEFASPLRKYAIGRGMLAHYDGTSVLEQITPFACFGAEYTSLEIGPEGVFLAGGNFMSRGPVAETEIGRAHV